MASRGRTLLAIAEATNEWPSFHLQADRLLHRRLRGFYTAVLSEAWAKLRDWASVAGRGRLLLSGSVAHASLKTAVVNGD